MAWNPKLLGDDICRTSWDNPDRNVPVAESGCDRPNRAITANSYYGRDVNSVEFGDLFQWLVWVGKTNLEFRPARGCTLERA
jgi:hypothetical protein